jgi:acyl-CoA synthetase (AMP-forming)/AMP-acid ligase II
MTVQTAHRDLAELSRFHAAVRPERVALTFEGRETTYGQLDRRASRVANGLLATCATTQARVAVLDKNSDSFFELLFGAARARDVLVPVNWRLAPPEIAYVVNDAQAEILFVGDEYVDTIQSLLPELRTVKQVVALSGGHPDWEGYAACGIVRRAPIRAWKRPARTSCSSTTPAARPATRRAPRSPTTISSRR